MDYADASGINLSDMGSFGGGGGKDGGMQPPEFGMDRKQGPNASGFTPEMQPPSFDMDAFPDDPGGDFSGSQFPSRENDTEAAMDTQMIDPDNSEKNGSEEVSPDFEREEMPDNIQGAFPTPGNGHGNGDRMMTSDGMPGDFQQTPAGSNSKSILVWCIVSVLILSMGLLIAKKYK